MFERFSERARQVVVIAQEEARMLKHDHVGTEHILLGLLCEEEGLAARVLESLGLTVEQVRSEVVRIVGSTGRVTHGQIPFDQRARKVLELALREALHLGHNDIATEHILLGLVRETEGVAARILLDFNADAEKIRREVIRMLSGPSGRRAVPETRSDAARRPASTEFDRNARLAIDLAKQEALSLGQDEVRTEHLLLGLQLSGRGLAASVLTDLGVTIERARPLLIAIVGHPEPRADGEIPLASGAKRALDRAAQEALDVGAGSIGTEHILLSLAADNGGVLGRILLELEVTPQQIRSGVRRRANPPQRIGYARLIAPTPGLDWAGATLLWRPEGLELRVPLHLDIAAMAAFANDEIWSTKQLAGLRREIWDGWLALASPTLLEDIENPVELRRLLDAAAQRAIDAKLDGSAAADFLSRLRNEP